MSPTQAQVDDAEVERVVEARIDALLAWMSKHPQAETSSVTVKLSFFQTRQRSQWFGSSSEERVVWEQWNFQLRVRDPDEGDVGRRAELGEAVRRSMLFILSSVSDKMDHVPPVSTTSSGAVTHPFEIGGWEAEKSETIDALKRLVRSTSTPGPPINVL